MIKIVIRDNLVTITEKKDPVPGDSWTIPMNEWHICTLGIFSAKNVMKLTVTIKSTNNMLNCLQSMIKSGQETLHNKLMHRNEH